MKAKIKATGEIFDVHRIKAVAGNNLYVVKEEENKSFHPEELEPVFDEHKIHIKASTDFEQAILSNYDFFADGIRTECNKSGKKRTQVIAQMAIELADEFITQLKLKFGNDGN